MSLMKVVAVLLIAAGVAGLVYGGFTYTKETHDAGIGPLKLQWKDKEKVKIPTWAGVGAIAAGSALLLFGGKRRR